MKTYLAHFTNSNGSLAGGQEIKANSKEQAMLKGERAAKRLGKTLADVTGPEEECNEF